MTDPQSMDNMPEVITTAKYDPVPDKFFIEAVAEEDYFDDSGINYGLSVWNIISDLSVTLNSNIPLSHPSGHKFAREDHQLHKLAGKKLRITVEVIDA